MKKRRLKKRTAHCDESAANERAKRREREAERIVHEFAFNKVDDEEECKVDLDAAGDEEDFVVEDNDERNISRLLREQGVLVDEVKELERSFVELHRGRVNSFLTCDVIQRKFSSVTQVLATLEPEVKNLWVCMWQSTVKVVSLKRPQKRTCSACNRSRIVQSSLECACSKCRGQRLLVGPDCLEVKIVPLMNLVRFCLQKATDIDGREIRSGLDEMLEPIRGCFRIMKERYSDREDDF